jgi:hypothetical protein
MRGKLSVDSLRGETTVGSRGGRSGLRLMAVREKVEGVLRLMCIERVGGGGSLGGWSRGVKVRRGSVAGLSEFSCIHLHTG